MRTTWEAPQPNTNPNNSPTLFENSHPRPSGFEGAAAGGHKRIAYSELSESARAFST